MIKKIDVVDELCAKRLKEIRESLSITQQDIAGIIGVSKATIQQSPRLVKIILIPQMFAKAKAMFLRK